MRGEVVTEPIHAGTHLSGGIFMMQGQCIARDHNHQHEQDRHHAAGYTLDATLDTVIYDNSGDAHEQKGEHHR